MQVGDLMSKEVVTLGESDVLVSAEELMGLRRFRHLPVVDKQGGLVGILTRRDILAASLPGDTATRVQKLVHSATVKVSEIMHRQVESVSVSSDLAAAARLMASKKIGCLPVTDEGKVVGILTEADFVRMAAHLLERAEYSGGEWVNELRDSIRNVER
jgi:CBS domain-containing membrane protein